MKKQTDPQSVHLVWLLWVQEWNHTTDFTHALNLKHTPDSSYQLDMSPTHPGNYNVLRSQQTITGAGTKKQPIFFTITLTPLSISRKYVKRDSEIVKKKKKIWEFI